MTKPLSSFVSIVVMSLFFFTSRTFAFYNSATTLFGTTAHSSLYSRHYYQQAQGSGRTNGNTFSRIMMVTITEERTETDRSTRYDSMYDDDDDFDEDDYDDLEYLMDSKESRAWEDPFHILLLGQTFDKPKVTISYVTGSLEVRAVGRTLACLHARFILLTQTNSLFFNCSLSAVCPEHATLRSHGTGQVCKVGRIVVSGNLATRGMFVAGTTAANA